MTSSAKTEQDLLAAGWKKIEADHWVMPNGFAHMNFKSAVTMQFGWAERERIAA